MEGNNRTTGFCLKILKCFLTLPSRFKKIRRKLNMRSLKITISLAALGTGIITLVYTTISQSYYTPLKQDNFSNTPTTRVTPHQLFYTRSRHIPLNEIYKDVPRYNHDYSIEFEETKQAHMVDTPGCKIPVSILQYEKITKREQRSCGERIVFLKKYNEDNIKVTIRNKSMKKLLKKSTKYHCCYRFFQASKVTGNGNTKLRYTVCKKIKDGDTFNLEHDFINVQCFEIEKHNKSRAIYDDVYAFTKKIKLKQTSQTCKEKYNVLILGMDSMSLSRFVQTMTRTMSIFTDNYWLCYRGYHKIGDNTFPNIMATFTGLDMNDVSEKCTQKMDQCNDIFIWSHFKKAGYVTAYGEDHLRLPDTFSKDYKFHRPPTDHYMKPFYINGERELFNKSLLCAGKASSGQQLIDYASDFVLTYRKDNFFGFFWMNSFSHNINNRPEEADNILENFFNQLSYTGIFDNTFVIFFSDHGIRFGEHRLKIESFYDDRMPFLFMWTPTLFRSKYPKKLKSVIINQFRLITPYDLFHTLLEISQTAFCDSFPASFESKTYGQSIFSTVSGNRTCRDVGIHEKWCSCHKLYPLDLHDIEGVKSVQFVVNHIQEKIKTIETKRCMKCVSLSLKNVTRIHFYYDKEKYKLFHVIAISMQPENIFYEATVSRKDTGIDLVGPVSIISSYKGFGKCTINLKERVFCVCQKILNCQAN